jgi:hypothetical protein
MKSTLLACALSCALSGVACAEVNLNVQVPASNSVYTQPILIAASGTSSSPYSVSGWAVWFSNSSGTTEYYSNSTGLNGILNVTLSNVPTGTYTKVTVQVWNSDGQTNTSSADNVTVVASPMPTPPQGTQEYVGLQNNSNGSPGTWTYCTDIGCSGSQGSGCSGSIGTTGVTPFLSGTAQNAPTALSQSVTGAACNILNYRAIKCPNISCDSVQSMLLDEWFYPESTADVEQFEFDPDLFDTNNYEYFGSVACRLQGTNPGHWYTWNMAGNSWYEMTSTTCTASTVAAGKWHHLQLYVTFDTSNQTYTYQTFVFDGVTEFENLGLPFSATHPSYQATETVNVEQQIDNAGTDSTDTAIYDDDNLWVW